MDKDKELKVIPPILITVGIISIILGFVIFLSSNRTTIEDSKDSSETNEKRKSTKPKPKSDKLEYDENLKYEDENNIVFAFKESIDGIDKLVILDGNGKEIKHDLDVKLLYYGFYLDNDILYYIDSEDNLKSYDFDTNVGTDYYQTVDPNAISLYYNDNKIFIMGNQLDSYNIEDPTYVEQETFDVMITYMKLKYNRNNKCLYYVGFTDSVSIYCYSTDTRDNILVEQNKYGIFDSNDQYLIYLNNDREKGFEVYVLDQNTGKSSLLINNGTIINFKNPTEFYYIDKDNNIVYKNGDTEKTIYSPEDGSKLSLLKSIGDYVFVKDSKVCSEKEENCENSYKYYLIDLSEYKYKELKGDINKYDITEIDRIFS